MKKTSYYDAITYECRIKALQKQVKDYESGEKYVHMTETHKKDMENMRKQISGLKLELASARSQVVSVRNLWFEVFEDLQEEHKTELEAVLAEKKAMEERALRAERQRDEALDKLTDIRRRFADTAAALEESEEKNKKLLAQLNHNYENSSIPSSKAVVHKKIANSREKTGRKPGAQPGHPHHGRKKQDGAAIVELPEPDWILRDQDFKDTGKEAVKQMIGIKLLVDVTEYHAHIFRNTRTNEEVHAAFPEGVVDDVNYDASVKAFLYLLNNDCCTSLDKSRKFLYDLSGGRLNISKGMVNKLNKNFSDKTSQEINETFHRMLSAPVMHTDCTNANVNGKSAYVYICAVPDGDVLYFARPKKGHEGVRGTVTEDYQGILIHDHEATFANYGTKHQECLAHVLRYLKDSMENEPSLTWNTSARSLLKEMIHYRNGIPEGSTADPAKVAEYENRYDVIMQTAEREYTDEPPGKYYKDGYNLFKRMKEEKEKYLLFLHDTRVPATNNLAERCLRTYKRKQAQATVFRSFDSISYLSSGMSVLHSIRRKNDANVFAAVKKIFEKKD